MRTVQEECYGAIYIALSVDPLITAVTPTVLAVGTVQTGMAILANRDGVCPDRTTFTPAAVTCWQSAGTSGLAVHTVVAASPPGSRTTVLGGSPTATTAAELRIRPPWPRK